MSSTSPKNVRQRKLASTIMENQSQGQPVHTWPSIQNTEPDDWKQGYRTVGQFMSTDLFTVQPDDLIDLAANVMDWRHIRHVPVEDGDGNLVGLVTHRSLLRMLANGNRAESDTLVTVRQIMVSNPITVSPSTSSLEAIEIMRSSKIGCLPVVEENHLIGIVTSFDFLDASAHLFKEQLASSYTEIPARANARSASTTKS
jgi:CBS domain-containing protein